MERTMQDYNDNNQNNNRRKIQNRNQSANGQNQNRAVKRQSAPGTGERQTQRPVQNGQSADNVSRRAGGQGKQHNAAGQRPPQRANGTANGQRPPQRVNGTATEQRPPQRANGTANGQKPAQRANGTANGQKPPQRANGQRPPQRAGASKGHKRAPLTPQAAKKKKRRKIILFTAEIFLLLILVGVLWMVNKTNKITHAEINVDKVSISNEIQEQKEEGTSKLLGYKNIALFGVDSREGELKKNTRTDVIMIVSINQDTKEVRLVSVYRDTWLNMSTDTYRKANAAYAQGGAEQAIGMLNMNLDLDITEYVTVGFEGVIDVINAVGGVEIDVKKEEIQNLNDYQISMVGRPTGTKNAAGDDNYEAIPNVEYTPVTHAGLQKLDGLQATAYMRIRYVGNDYERTARQRRVITEVAKKAVTLNPIKLNDIANAVFPHVSTSLDMTEITGLLADVASYKIGETSGFPFSEYRKEGYVGSAAVVIPVDLTKNVSLLHEFLFNDSGYEPTETVKKCSQKISADTGVSYNGE